MSTPFNTIPHSVPQPSGAVRVVPHYDVQWLRPIFRPPSLPTPATIYTELPFTAFRGPRIAKAG